jgi:hypothetical protein
MLPSPLPRPFLSKYVYVCLQETYQYCGIGIDGVDPVKGIFIPPASTFNPTDVDTDLFVLISFFFII